MTAQVPVAGQAVCPRGGSLARGPVPEAPPTTWVGSSWCLGAACWHGRSQLSRLPSLSSLLPLRPLGCTREPTEDSDLKVTARLSLGGSRFPCLLGSRPYWWDAVAVCVRVSVPGPWGSSGWAVGLTLGRLGPCQVWCPLLEPSVAPRCPLHTHTVGLMFSSSVPCSQPRSVQAVQAPGGQAHCPACPGLSLPRPHLPPWLRALMSVLLIPTECGPLPLISWS